MAFGQQAGPPASGKQVQELIALIEQAGHLDLRDARGALNLTQRQAGGKFTRDEATALIEQLLEAQEATGENDGDEDDRAAPAPPAVSAAARFTSSPTTPAKPTRTIRDLPAARLATELERRGWVVIPPVEADGGPPAEGAGPP